MMVRQALSSEPMPANYEQVVVDARAIGGAMDGAFPDDPRLLLTMTDATSGQPHIISVNYTRDGSRTVVIAAKQGEPTHPGWYHNITANPNVTIEVGDESFRAVAHIAEGAERQRLFEEITGRGSNFQALQHETALPLLVVVLERVLDKSTDYQAFNRDFIAEFRTNGGKVGGIFETLPLLLLTTIGAKSGNPRIAPVLYGTDNGRFVIVASKGGSPTNPDWYHNLVANPNVTVEVGTESFPALAMVAEGAERQRLFKRLLPLIPKLAETQESTPRRIPIVVLERTS